VGLRTASMQFPADSGFGHRSQMLTLLARVQRPAGQTATANPATVDPIPSEAAR
jgi:hypothetical protein